MTELEKAARMALEALKSVTDYDRINEARRALTQALATTERTLNDTLRDIDAATCPECGGLGVSDPGEPDSPEGPGRPAVDCKPCKGTGWRNGVHLSDRQPSPTERKGEPSIPAGWVACRIEHEPGYPEDVAYGPQRMMSRLKKWLDKHFANTSPQVPEDVMSVLSAIHRRPSDAGIWLDDLTRIIRAARKGE